MSAPRPRSALRACWILALLVVLPVLGLSAGVAAAQTDEPPSTEREISVNVVDRQGTAERDDDEPVAEAVIVVTDATDEVIDEVTTDEDGKATITLPGEGQYTARLVLDSLDEDAGLPREGRETVSIDPTRARFLNFVVGDRERATRGTLDKVPQLLFNGLSFGLIIAITSVGLSLIFGTTGLVNFAHSEHVTFGAIVAWWINVDHGVHIIPAAILAVLIGGAAGAIVDRGLWAPLRHRGMSLIAMMIVSIGLSLAARSLLQLLFGGVFRPYRQFYRQEAIDIGPITTTPKDIWMIVLILVVIVGVASLLQYSRIGKAMRAVSDNGDLAAASGIDVDRVVTFVWVLGSGLAALGGVLFGLQQQVHFEMGFRLLLLMFAGVVLGGLGTAYGALVGSFVVGMFVEVSTLVIATELKNVGALLVLIVVLLFRPQGILGRAERIG
ncbi:MAG TPA: SpaA isopeptide-forming pilin-related protein [Acidimicrobiales bacterium]|nr:SpaA isopeptide-forming pilin-related protein [Acidimicrobiales bacterium]